MCSSRSGWGTVCNRHWTQANSRVVCRSLGYSEEGREKHNIITKMAIRSLLFVGSYQITNTDNRGQGILAFTADYVKCQGSEYSLKECIHFSHSYGCSHDEDAEIFCGPGKKIIAISE